MVKYKLYFQKMLEEERALFESFKATHDKYVLDPEAWREEFNKVGRGVQDAVRNWENKLCGHSEAGKYGVFSVNLAEKFRVEIRRLFPKIDEVGLKVVKRGFEIKKISL